MCKRVLVLLLIAMSCCRPVLAEGQGGTEIALLQSGLGARAVGMGSAFTPVANDSASVYWNPAGMLFTHVFEVGSMQTKLATDFDVYYLTAVAQGRTGEQVDCAWGVYWVNGTLSDIPLVTENEGVTVNTDVKPADYTSYQSHAFGIAYAGWLASNLGYGINLTGFYQDFDKLEQGRSVGFSVTPGLMWLLDHRFVAGVVVRDLLNLQHWSTGTDESVCPEARAGVSWEPLDGVLVACDLRQKLDSRYAATANLGTEWSVLQFLLLRAGLDHGCFTAGCGIYMGTFTVDYAYTGETDIGIGDSHRVGLGLRL